MDRRLMGFLAFLLLLAGGCGNGEEELAEARKFGASAYDYYMKASEAGNVRATLRLAYEYQSEAPILFLPKMEMAEANRLIKLAEQQDAERTYRFISEGGFVFWHVNGKGVVVQPWVEVEAARRWRKSAEQGDAEAQCNLGLCYEKGQGVGQSWTKAARCYRKSAEQGNARGLYCLGWCYRYGKGVGQNTTEAATLYRQAAQNGFNLDANDRAFANEN